MLMGRRAARQCVVFLGATVAIMVTAVRTEAQENGAFYEIETKYIFGFTSPLVPQSVLKVKKHLNPTLSPASASAPAHMPPPELSSSMSSHRTSICKSS